MLGVRSAQRGLLEADHLYLDYVGLGLRPKSTLT